MVSVLLALLPLPLAVCWLGWVGLLYVSEHSDRLALIPEDLTQIDNHLYDSVSWWGGDSSVAALLSMNEVRVPYFLRQMTAERKVPAVSPQEDHSYEVLDIGCGGGFVSLALAERGYQVTGLDMSPNSVLEASRVADKKGLSSRALFLQGSLYQLPFDSQSFDTVVISDVLEHLTDLRSAMREIHRVLKPGGLVVFDTIARTPYSFLFLWLGAQKILNILPKDAHDWRLFIQPSEMETLLRDHGFEWGVEGRPWKGIHISLSLWPGKVMAAIREGSLVPIIAEVVETDWLVGSYAGWARKAE